MKKLVIGMLCVLLAASLAVAGCGGGQKAEKGKAVTLKMGHVADAKNVWHLASLKFADLVDKKTNGTVKIKVFESSQLGNDRDATEGLQMGSIDLWLIPGTIGNFYPPIQLLDLPYLFESQQHIRKVMYGPIGEEMKQGILKATNIRVLEFWERGPRQLTSNKPVNSIDDIKGLKVRTAEIPPWVAAWKAMGANPTPMAFGEVYTGLQQGTIDAQENPYAIIVGAKLNEVQKYIAMTDHVFGYVMLSISGKTYDKLTPDQQKAIMEAAREATDWQNKTVAESEDKLLKELLGKGMTVTKPDKSEFIKRAKSIHGEFADKFGKDIYKKIVAAAK